MKNKILWLFLLLGVTFSGCNKDEGDPIPEVKSRFTVLNDENDGFKVNIQNDSEAALTYEWDFGDGSTGTQSDTAFSHTYEAAGTYTITLTAVNGTVKDISTKEVVVAGMTFKQFLAGTEAAGKIWRLEYEAGMVMLNPANYGDWWYSWTKNHGFALELRNTVRHNQYIFKPNGSFEFKTEGWTLRPGQFFGATPDPKGWPDEASWEANGKDCSAWGNNANLTFEIQNASYYADCKFGRIVLKGKGGHIGPMDTGTELVVDEPAEETFYEVYHYGEGGSEPDTLVLFTPWGGNENGAGAARGTQIGRITLVAYKSEAQIPADEEPEVVVEKPLKAENISDNFDDEAVNITWVQDNTPALFDEAFDNPASGGINTSAKVAKYVRGTQDYANIQFELPFRMNLTTRNVFKMKVYIDAAAAVKTVAVKLQDTKMGGNAWQTQTEKKIQDVATGSWVELTFDFSEVATNENYDKIVVQFGDEGANKGDGTFYFDDFQLQ